MTSESYHYIARLNGLREARRDDGVWVSWVLHGFYMGFTIIFNSLLSGKSPLFVGNSCLSSVNGPWLPWISLIDFDLPIDMVIM